MKIKIFGKQNCAKCETTKNKLNHFLKKNNRSSLPGIEFYDMDTVEGMAESAYHDVLHVPTTIIENNGQTLKRWDGEVPNTQDFQPVLIANPLDAS